MNYLQHFAAQTKDYHLFRPDYPMALFDYLFSLVKEFNCAWDCGTGNGQAALVLANNFSQVLATDLSYAQLTHGSKSEAISYICCAAEKPAIATSSIDLITVAQALHWFDLPAFYEEVKRISKPTGLFAAWCYSLAKINNSLNEILYTLYEEILGENYWPLARHYIDKKYQTIIFPFTKIKTPPFLIKKQLNFSQFLGYLNTWSAVKEYKKREQINPVNLVFKELASAWGGEIQREVHWPVYLLAGYVHKD